MYIHYIKNLILQISPGISPVTSRTTTSFLKGAVGIPVTFRPRLGLLVGDLGLATWFVQALQQGPWCFFGGRRNVLFLGNKKYNT